MRNNAKIFEPYLKGQRDPDEILRELDRIDAAESLRHFIELSWDVLEPGREFQSGWHLDAICEHLEAVHEGQIKRLLINVPPGAMKSLSSNVFFPAWEWGPKGRPDLRYISTSYSSELSVRDNRRARILIQSNWYQDRWGDEFCFVSDQNAKIKFETDHRGFKIATSVSGVGTGERADRVIIDDPHNVKEGESEAKRNEVLLWFTEVMPTRLNDPENSAIIVIMQRVHEADVSGLILERELGYEHLCLPMEYDPSRHCVTSIGFEDPRTVENELLWPDRMTRAVVERDKKVMGPYATAGQFQQRPSPRGGGLFKRKWWRFFETSAKGFRLQRPIGCYEGEAEPLPSLDWVVISIDAAFKAKVTGSRVGILVVGGSGPFRYVLENHTRHMTFRETCDTIATFDPNTGRINGGLLNKFPHCSRVLIEDKANGSAIVDTMRQRISGIIPVTPEGGKESRGQAIQPAVESGHVFLPEGAPWLEDFITELGNFPAGAHDDQVDALSQALIYMTASVDVARAMGMANL